MPEDCILCQIAEGKIPSKKVYEDDSILAVLDINGAAPGHCFVMPKQHFTIIEQVPDGLAAHIFSTANRISSAVFESLNIQGTNIFVENGVAAGQNVAHFMVQVIPRNENDGINLDLQPKQLSEEEMSTIELKLKDETKNTGYVNTPKKEPQQKAVQSPTKKASPQDVLEDDEEDYLIKSLRRIP